MELSQKLYWQNSLLFSFSAQVTQCVPQGQVWAVELNQTAFYPEGGGQPCDLGTLGDAQVLDVQQKDGIVWHTVSQPLAVGSTVSGAIDATRRLDLMQQHTGEHILSGLLHSMFGTENVGFHIGQQFVTMDINKPLSDAQLLQAETAANEIVWNNTPVVCSFPTSDELQTLHYRSKKEIAEQIRIVSIKGADCCACCGTHLPFCGMVGQIKILDSQNYKGGTRLTVVCGMRALNDFRTKCGQLAQIGAMLSVPSNNAFSGVQTLFSQLQTEKAQLAKMQNRWFDAVCKTVLPTDSPLFCADGLNGEALRSLCLRLCEKTPLPCAVFSANERGLGYAIGQTNGDISVLVGQMHSTFGGKGGGKPFLQMGSVPADFEQIQLFWNKQKNGEPQ